MERTQRRDSHTLIWRIMGRNEIEFGVRAVNKMKVVLSGLLLALSFGLSAQQTQPTTATPAPPPAVVHHKAPPPSQTPAATQAPKPAPVAPAAAPTPKPAAPVPLSNDNHYVNSSGNIVHSPAKAPSVPQGATAVCGDGSYSFSQHRQGTCSHHGGVSRWL